MTIKAQTNNGFTLLETLIALLVLSFGLLGLAGLQLKTLQSSHSSYQRGLANIIAADAVERLWANMGGCGTIDRSTNSGAVATALVKQRK